MRKKVALLAGGYTGEYVVSLNSAQQIEHQLDENLYEVYKIIINKTEWYYESKSGQKIQIDKNDFSLLVDGDKINFDVVFIIVHGSPGEDGKMQSYFDLLQIPYTTCDATTSAITMNKAYTKAVVKDINGLNTANSIQLFTQENSNTKEIESQLKLPLFIKPNNGGSSIGMSKVNSWDELQEALNKAFAEDNQILIEEFIKGREFTVGAYLEKGEIKVLPITEIKSSKEFFDYEAKYTAGVTQEITPAEIAEEQTLKVGEIVKSIYSKLNCKGMVRVDFILQDFTEEFFFIEINTVPGQSENSIIPQQVRAAGMKVKDFYSLLIEEALT
ncbi:D-alanine--D-alanine ligase [Pedobacter psychrophilus]|uniref:D-alanine--D-alanine ligase n=1 Tax=Pedobacter psychrophilus TaxID=1826909 RepID=A0A179DIA0_9SPHI|nr:D-alanine--D-alanine ligase [Pedobacter psychrophilus]OAQ40614.1 D-alanine--D-alanine ligase [Pedobacter psychrophilus]